MIVIAGAATVDPVAIAGAVTGTPEFVRYEAASAGPLFG